MGWKNFVLVACIMYTAGIIVSGKQIVDPNPHPQGGGNINLVFLGTADGKSYFADNEAKTWLQAKAYCISLQMHLATVTSRDQWNILNAAYNNVTFTGHYWTSARDAHEMRQLSWDINGTAISSTSVLSFGSDLGSTFLTCASLYSTSATALSLHIDLCTKAYPVLCET